MIGKVESQTRASFSEKSHCFQERAAPKKVFLLEKKLFGKSTRFEKVHVLNTYFQEVAVLKKMIRKSICYQEVVVRKT